MKQTEKEYRIRVTTTEEMHEVIKNKLNEIYQNIKNGMPNVLDVEYYVHGMIEKEEMKFNGG
jgi:hypothetical protein